MSAPNRRNAVLRIQTPPGKTCPFPLIVSPSLMCPLFLPPIGCEIGGIYPAIGKHEHT